MGGALLYLDAVRPGEQALGTTPKETAPRTTRTHADTGAFTIAGLVQTTDGVPLPDVVVRCSKTELRTGPDGRFRGEVSRCLAWLPDLASLPFNVEVVEATEELDFTVAPICARTVEVYGPDGPLEGASVTDRVYSPEFPRPATVERITDDSGRAELPMAQCGRVTLSAVSPGLAIGVLHEEVEAPTTLRLDLVRGTRVHGTVRTDDGEAVSKGTVRAAYTTAYADIDPDGSYELRLAPGDWRIYASAHIADVLTADRDLVLLPGTDELQVDFTLSRFRQLEVYCKGLPDDSCGTIFPVMCTSPRLPVGETCRGSQPTYCACPPGEAAVRGGGRSVEVHPQDEAVWLDFTATGAIRGAVRRDGEPFRCSYGALRLPDRSMDLIGGGLHARSGRCDEDGSFEVAGLDPGRWAFEIYASDARWPQDDVWIESDVVDVGTIDLDAGGTITVQVVDGLTGAPAEWEPVAANLRGRGSANPVGHGGMTGPDGVLELTGLEDGVYDVFCASAPLDRQTVTITDGSAHDVELARGDGSLLEAQGFEVATDDHGDLVVADLDPDGAAAQAGLRSGDVLLGVSMVGVDVLSWAPQFADDATRWVLENTDGSGVVLVVERDDALLDIALQ